MIEKAIKFALKCHENTYRKNSDFPFIMHPLEVANTIIALGGDENTIVAGILHDTIEDTNVTYDEILNKFNKDIADLVKSQTEDKMIHMSRKDSWKIRKQTKLNYIQNCNDIRVKMIAFADKLSNLKAINRDKKKYGKDMWKAFNQDDENMQSWYYENFLKLFIEFKDKREYKEYVYLLKDTFKK